MARPLERTEYEHELLERLKGRGLDGMLRKLADESFVPMFEIVSRTRRPTPTRARHEMWRQLRDEHEFSFNEIAALFDRDHTTIMSGIRNARARLELKQAKADTNGQEDPR